MGSVVTFTSRGDLQRTYTFLNKLKNLRIQSVLESYGQMGVAALSSATPEDSGLAAGSWGYEVTGGSGGWTISWTNSDLENGFPVAVMIQYGHGTGTGGYVAGRDYINPAIQPIFDKIANEVWKVVTSA